MTKRKRKAPALPSYPPLVLDAVNTMERSRDTLEVATAALVHAALTRPNPDFFGAMHANRHADVVLAALYRRGMVDG